MRYFFFCIFYPFVLLCTGFGTITAAHGETVVAIQNINIRPFQEAMRGFRKACKSDVTDLDISGMTGAKIAQKIDQLSPDLLLAVGTSSLSKIKTIKSIPIIYMMILNPESILTREDNISGVSIHVPYDKQIEIFSRILPETKTIGLVYHPDHTGHLEKRAKIAARRAGIDIISEPIYQSKDGPTKIENLKDRVDAFWMLPDISVITPDTVSFLLVTSFKYEKPILSFSEKYVKMGALAAVTMDPFDIGLQAGEMAEGILKFDGKKGSQRADARKAVLSINNKIAEKFGIEIDQEIRERARSIH